MGSLTYIETEKSPPRNLYRIFGSRFTYIETEKSPPRNLYRISGSKALVTLSVVAGL